MVSVAISVRFHHLFSVSIDPFGYKGLACLYYMNEWITNNHTLDYPIQTLVCKLIFLMHAPKKLHQWDPVVDQAPAIQQALPGWLISGYAQVRAGEVLSAPRCDGSFFSRTWNQMNSCVHRPWPQGHTQHRLASCGFARRKCKWKHLSAAICRLSAMHLRWKIQWKWLCFLDKSRKKGSKISIYS